MRTVVKRLLLVIGGTGLLAALAIGFPLWLTGLTKQLDLGMVTSIAPLPALLGEALLWIPGPVAFAATIYTCTRSSKTSISLVLWSLAYFAMGLALGFLQAGQNGSSSFDPQNLRVLEGASSIPIAALQATCHLTKRCCFASKNTGQVPRQVTFRNKRSVSPWKITPTGVAVRPAA